MTPKQRVISQGAGRLQKAVNGLFGRVRGAAGRTARVLVPGADGGAMLLGRFNTASGTTLLSRSDGFGPGLFVTSADGTGVFAAGSPGVYCTGGGGPGVYGTGAGAGVFGAAQDFGSVGVWGNALANDDTVPGGVVGTGFVGVRGSGSSGGVSGDAPGGGVGVLGRSSIGVYGISTGADTGLMSGGIGIYGTNEGSGVAARFDGTIIVNGAVIANIKSAMVPHPDGTRRRLYCLESPDCWFEDFGEGRLTAGAADIRLDEDFAALVRTADYHVFLTPHDAGCAGLAVVARRADRFEVRELAGGTSSGAFSYQIVARRNDIETTRLDLVPPQATATVTPPELPAIPQPPQPPPDHVASQGR